jgi:hypothetical protein
VKPSVLAGRLEKPFRLFICRYWHCVSKIFIGEDFISDLRREGIFLLARVGVGIRSLELDASLLLAAYWYLGVEFPFPSVSLAGRDSSCGHCWILSSEAACSLSWSCSSHFEQCCVRSSFGAAWRHKRRLAAGRPPLLAVHCITEEVFLSFEAAISLQIKQQNHNIYESPSFISSWDSFGINFLMAVCVWRFQSL